MIRAHTALFVGRERELERLDALFEQPSGVLIVTAPAGYGKTALLANWLDQRHGNGCFIAHHFFRREYDDANRLDSVPNALFNLLRQLYIYYGVERELPPRDEGQLRDALLGLLQERGALPEEPLVLLLDGLDEAEKELLPPLPSPLPEGVYVVVAIRADETETPAMLRPWMQMQVQRMHLQSLPHTAVIDYLARAGDGELAAYAQDASFVELVLQKTEGYPLHLRFLVDDLLQVATSGGDVRAALERTPQGFDNYVREQLRHLARSLANAEKVQRLFALLATALGALSEREIEALTELNAFELEALPREATRWFSITERDGARFYAFTHPTLGDAFEGALGALAHEARQQLLDYCARWQEHRSPYALRHYPAHLREANRTDTLYQLARDEAFLQAQRETLPAEPDLPLRTLQTALDAAIAQEHAPIIAEMMLRHAHRAAQAETPLDALRQGNMERAIGLAKQALERDYTSGTLWLLLLAWNRHHAGDASGAERCLTEITQWWKGRTLEKLRDGQEEATAFMLTPLSHLPSASKVAVQTLSDERLESFALRWAQIGEFVQALAIAQQIERAGSRSWALVKIAQAMAQIGEFAQALAIAQQIEWAYFRSRALVEIGQAMAQIGEFAQALAIAQQIEGAYFRSEALVGLGQAMAQIGATEEAQAVLQQAVEAAQQIEWASHRAEALVKIAQALTQVGEHEHARTVLREAWEAAHATGLFSTLWKVAQTAAELGFDDLAVDYARQIAGHRADDLPQVLNALTERGAKGAFLQLLPLCAWERLTALRACACLIAFYPAHAAAIAEQARAWM
ncbi:HTH-type transcriptional regulator MalT [bacterium HR15]|nr:HTH-type transcriptional regulator MalT [bacterium HR15]